MKKIKFNIYYSLLLLVGVLFLYSCSEDMNYAQNRLFQPVLQKDLSSELNTITVNMVNLKDAESYKVEISRDTFKTVLASFNSPVNNVKISNLLWNTLYQVRATAIASTPELSSHISTLGGIRTQPFPSILQAPITTEILDTQAKMTWLIGGADVTSVKVFALSDEYLATPLASYATTSAEILSGSKIISGLTPNTSYSLAIYSGATIRGWYTYTTKPALVLGSNAIDLRGIANDSSTLFTTLTNAADGSVIILDGNNTYDLSTQYYFNKSITIKSGYSFNPGGAIINLNTNFNLLAGSNVGAVIFDGVTLTSPDTAAAAKYVFNVNQSANIGEITFNNCRINNFRGVCRFQSGTGTVGKYTINNSIVSNIGGYGIFNVDFATWTAGDVLLKSSTVYRSSVFMASKSTSPTGSLIIEDCTLNEFVAKAGTMFKWVNEVTNGITIKNTIVGHGYDSTGGTDYTIIGYAGLAATNWTITSTYTTSDFAYVPLNLKTIPNFPNFNYAKTSILLWKNPINGDFSFIDTAFAGRKTCGDPRWRSIN